MCSTPFVFVVRVCVVLGVASGFVVCDSRPATTKMREGFLVLFGLLGLLGAWCARGAGGDVVVHSLRVCVGVCRVGACEKGC
jgi:hypothetical protein